jgi:hypothetical protein
MQIKTGKYFAVLLAPILFLGACSSSPSSLFIYPAPGGGIQYFFPMMEWQGDSKDMGAAIHAIGATCDITYPYGPGSQGIYNISFTYISKADTGKIPSVPSAITVTGDGVDYALTNIEILFSEGGRTRITSKIDGDDLFTLLKAQSISLTAVLDETEYRFTPPKAFFSYRDEFLTDVATRPGRS